MSTCVWWTNDDKLAHEFELGQSERYSSLVKCISDQTETKHSQDENLRLLAAPFCTGLRFAIPATNSNGKNDFYEV